jgi:hypothetical protein
VAALTAQRRAGSLEARPAGLAAGTDDEELAAFAAGSYP